MKHDSKIRNSINENLSGLYVSGQRHAQLMNEIVGGRKMKKKVSVAFVLVMTLVLLAMAGVAIGIWYETGEKVAALQATEAEYFEDWSTADKVKLVEILHEAGVFPEQIADQALKLGNDIMSEEAQDALACDILMTWTEGGLDTVTLDSILEKLNGPIGTWSMEDLVWYNSLLEKNGLLTDADTAYILPQKGEDITQAEAVAIAKQTFHTVYGTAMETLDGFTIAATFVLMDYELSAYEIAYEKGDKIWSVILTAEKSPASPPYYIGYHSDIRNDGEVLSYTAWQQHISPVRQYPPKADDLSETEVIDIAKKALMDTFGISADTADEYSLQPALTVIDLMPEENDPYKLGDRMWTVDVYKADAAVPTVDQPVFNVMMRDTGEVVTCTRITP